jgi:hypothetical protein
MHPNLPAEFLLKTHPVWHPGGRFWALREATYVTEMGQKFDRQKVAMPPNGWLYKIILPAISLILSSSFYLGTILIQFHPPANATPDFQKREKKEIHFQNA